MRDFEFQKTSDFRERVFFKVFLKAVGLLKFGICIVMLILMCDLVKAQERKSYVSAMMCLCVKLATGPLCC